MLFNVVFGRRQVAAELRVATRKLDETKELMDARLASKSDCRGVLKLTCIRANLDQVSGDCDPYCEIQYLTKEAARSVTPEGEDGDEDDDMKSSVSGSDGGDSFDPDDETRRRTKPMTATKRPVWGDTFTFTVYDFDSSFKLSLFDFDRFSDDDFLVSLRLWLARPRDFSAQIAGFERASALKARRCRPGRQGLRDGRAPAAEHPQRGGRDRGQAVEAGGEGLGLLPLRGVRVPSALSVQATKHRFQSKRAQRYIRIQLFPGTFKHISALTDSNVNA